MLLNCNKLVVDQTAPAQSKQGANVSVMFIAKDIISK